MKRLLCILLSLCLLSGLLPMRAAPASAEPAADSLPQIQIGEYITMGEYDGIPIVWQVIHQDGELLMLYCAEALLQGEYDASDHLIQISGIPVSHYGSSSWRTSDVRTFLNARDDVVFYDTDSEFRMEWLLPYLPKATEDFGTVAEPVYADEPGFLSGFSTLEQCLIETVSHQVIGAVTDTGHASTNYDADEYGTAFANAEAIYAKAGPVAFTDDVFLLSALEYKKYVVDQDLQQFTYNPYRDFAQIQFPFWLSDSVSMTSGVWDYYGMAHLAVNESFNPIYAHSGYGGTVFYSDNGRSIIRPACYINTSYLADLDGSGTFRDPYVLDIDQSVLARGKSKDLYKEMPAEWTITVYRNQDVPGAEPSYVLAKGAEVQVNGRSWYTDQDGTVTVPFHYGGISVSLSGYITRILDPYQATNSPKVYLEKQSVYPTVLAVWADGIDVLHSTYQLSLSKEKVTSIEADVDWGTGGKQGVVFLEQKGHYKTLEKNRGKIHWPGSQNAEFEPSAELYIAIRPDGSSVASMRRKLLFQPDTILPDQMEKDAFTLQLLGSKSKITLSENAGLLSDMELSYAMYSPLKYYMKVEDGKFYLVAGIDLEFKSKDGRTQLKSFFNYLSDYEDKISSFADSMKEMKRLGSWGAGKGSWSFSANFEVFYACEGYLSQEGPVVVLDEAGLLNLGFQAGFEWPFLVAGMPGFVNFSINPALEGKIKKWNSKTPGPDASLTGKLTLSGSGNLGISDVVSAGLGVKGVFTMRNEFAVGQETYSKLSLKVNPFVTAQILWVGMDADIEKLAANYTFYEYPNSENPDSLSVPGLNAEELYDQSRYRNVHFPPLANDFNLGSDYAVTDFGPAWTSADPQLIQLDDGKLMLFYISAGQNSDALTLMARFYDGKSWSAPMAVDPNGTPDVQCTAMNENGTAWVAWTDFAASTEGMDLTALAGQTRIKAACYDETSGSFTVYTLAEADGTLRQKPVFSGYDGQPYVTWRTNDEHSWIGVDGINRIVQSGFDGTAWSEPEIRFTTGGPITSMAAIGTVAFWTEDVDGRLETVNDTELFRDGTQVTHNDCPDQGLFKANGWLYWLHDGSLVILNQDSDEESDLALENVDAVSADCRILSQGTGERVLLYTQATDDEDSQNNILYARFCWDGVWMEEPIPLTDGKSRVLQFSGCFGEGDALELQVLAAKSDGTGARLFALHVPRQADLSLEDLSYDGAAFLDDGQLPLTLTVTNRGTAKPGQTLLEVLDSTGAVLDSRNYGLDLQPGQTKVLRFGVDRSAAVGNQPLSVRASLLKSEELRTDNNSLPLPPVWVDTALEDIRWGRTEDGQAVIAASVVNRGFVPSDWLLVHLRRGSMDGAVLETVTVSGLDTLHAQGVSFTVPFEEDAVYYLTVENAENDMRISNHSDFVVLQSEVGWTYENSSNDYDCHGDPERCPSADFTDAPAYGNWAHTPIDWAVKTGVTKGTSPTSFSPNRGCTRGQVVTFLWRAAGEPALGDGAQAAQNPFTDVKKGDYYYNAVLWAVEKGITKGTSANKFSPNKTCTRGQIVTFLWRYMGSPKQSFLPSPFTDVKTGDYYYTAMLWAVGMSITNGVSAKAFAPNRTCTRAQVVTFLYRATQQSPKNPGFRKESYQIVYDRRGSWADACQYAMAAGGKLLTIDSMEEYRFVTALLEEDGADLEYFSFYLGASRPEDGELYQWLDHDGNPYGTALNDPSNPMYGCWAIGEPELQSGSGKQYTCTAFTWSGTEKRWIWYTTNPDFNPHSTVFIIEFPHDGG